jgi:hypothetical protein
MDWKSNNKENQPDNRQKRRWNLWNLVISGAYLELSLTEMLFMKSVRRGMLIPGKFFLSLGNCLLRKASRYRRELVSR